MENFGKSQNIFIFQIILLDILSIFNISIAKYLFKNRNIIIIKMLLYILSIFIKIT